MKIIPNNHKPGHGIPKLIVLSKYKKRGSREESSSRFERGILEKYIELDNLYYSSGDSYNYILFEVDTNGNIKKYFRR